MKKERELYWEGGKQYLKNTRGVVFDVVKNSVLHRNSTAVYERLDYPTPPISVTGFNAVEDFKNYLIEEVSKELKIPLTQMKTMFHKKNNVSMLAPLEKHWETYRDTGWLYSHPHYLLETLHCNLFVTCEFNKSRNNIGKYCVVDKLLRNFHILDMWNKPLHIGDWGAGLGLTTLFMAAAFPQSTVYYIEINPATKKIFSKLVKRANLKNVVFVENLEDLPPLDVSVCIEYIEHIPDDNVFNQGDVMKAVDEVLSYTKDDGYFMYGTKWNDGKKGTPSLGHFGYYTFDGDVVEVLPRSRGCHQQLEKKMLLRGWHILNGNPNKNLWDFKHHKPYVFSKTPASQIKLLP